MGRNLIIALKYSISSILKQRKRNSNEKTLLHSVCSARNNKTSYENDDQNENPFLSDILQNTKNSKGTKSHYYSKKLYYLNRLAMKAQF